MASLLNAEAAALIRDIAYNLCLTPSCHVVYYSDDGGTFNKEHLRVPVWFKEKSPRITRIICYCNNVTDIEILNHIATRQCCHNLKDIRAHTGANAGHDLPYQKTGWNLM